MPARPVIDIRVFDGSAQFMQRGHIVRSGLGYGPGPEYGILYRLADGRYLGGVRHLDRGNLMTEIRFAATARAAMPRRWH